MNIKWYLPIRDLLSIWVWIIKPNHLYDAFKTGPMKRIARVWWIAQTTGWCLKEKNKLDLVI